MNTNYLKSHTLSGLYTVKEKSSRYLRNFSIRKRLMYLSYMVIGCMLLLFWILMFTSYKDVNTYVQQHNTKWLNVITNELESALSDLESVTKYPLIRLDSKPNLTYQVLTSPEKFASNVLFNDLSANRHFIFTQNESVRLVTVFDLQGKGTCLRNDDKYSYVHQNSNTVYASPEEAWFKATLKKKGSSLIWNYSGLSYLFSNCNYENSILATRAILNTEKMEYIGVILAAVDLSNILQKFEKEKLYPKQTISILDQNENLILGQSIDEETSFALKSHLQKVSANGKITIRTSNLQFRMYHYIRLESGYSCLIETYFSDILREFIRRNFILFIILIVVTCIIITFTNITVISITVPITRLTQACTAIKGGEFSYIIEDRYKDELSMYITVFNSMTKEINNLFYQVYQKDLILTQTELQMLRSQINPHVLYNTLEIIRANANLHKEPELADMVHLLGITFRYGTSLPSDQVTVEQEFEMLNNYIKLQNYLHKDKVSYIVHIEPRIKSYPILKFLIQPIVENAFFHGISTREKGGIISVLGIEDDNTLIFKISDNGNGLDAETTALLMEYMNGYNDHFKSIGLKNVNRRIKLFYGNSYGVNIQSSIGKGTVITVTIPIKEELLCTIS